MTANGGSEDDTHDAGTDDHPARRPWRASPRPSLEVVERIADETDRDPMNLPQLNDYVDPDALDKLLGSVATKGAEPAHVTFDYDGMRVTVDSTGAVTVEQ